MISPRAIVTLGMGYDNRSLATLGFLTRALGNDWLLRLRRRRSR